MAYEGSETLNTDVDALNERLRDAAPQEILRVAIERYGDKLALVSSFGAESAVLLHMAAQIDPNVTVLFLDTGMLFGQTLDYRQRLAGRLGLTDVRDLRPQFQDIAIHDPVGGPVEDRYRRLLQHPQGAAAGSGARGL